MNIDKRTFILAASLILSAGAAFPKPPLRIRSQPTISGTAAVVNIWRRR